MKEQWKLDSISRVVREVKKEGKIPRVHGNGFIQLDLTQENRLHIWGDKRIPRQQVSTPIHDHIFHFESVVLTGRIVNVTYGVTASHDGPFVIHEAVCRQGEDTILQDTGEFVTVRVIETECLTAGQTYRVLRDYFHETFVAEPTATVIHKYDLTAAQAEEYGRTVHNPRVLVPLGRWPDNEFDRFGHDTDLLWQIIFETLGG